MSPGRRRRKFCPSESRLRCVRAFTDSVTVLGDLAQTDARLTELVEGFRVPGYVLDCGARLLPVTALVILCGTDLPDALGTAP